MFQDFCESPELEVYHVTSGHVISDNAYDCDIFTHASPMNNNLNISVDKLLHDDIDDIFIGESADQSILKNNKSLCIISPENYTPTHPVMSPSRSINQRSTSTTLDHVDCFHPDLLNAYLLSDARGIRNEKKNGCNINKICQVCSDKASGFHYGVWSCEGCKAFFKRSIQGTVGYICPATNACTIDKHRRTRCQACRLRRCYEVGMDKVTGSQRKERKVSGTGQNKTLKWTCDAFDVMKNAVECKPTPTKTAHMSHALLVTEALSKADLPDLKSFHNHNLPPTRQHLLNSFVRLAEEEIEFFMNWAHHVPGYSGLSFGDQMHLIQCCWMEHILLKCAIRSMKHGGAKLVIASDLVLKRHDWSTIGMADVLEHVAAVSGQLVQYDLHNEELLLLQATILANAEVRKLDSSNKLNDIRQTISESFFEITQKYHPDNVGLVSSLPLLLVHIRQAADRAISYFQNVKDEGIVTFCKLLTEMLNAKPYEKEENH